MAVISQQVGLPFNEATSMLLEELVALATETGVALQSIEQKLDSIILGDYLAASDYLKQALDMKLSEGQRVYASKRSLDLFLRSHHRMANAGMHMESATSAGFCAVLYCIERNHDEAYACFLRSRQGFLLAASSMKKSAALTKKEGIAMASAFVVATVVPFGWVSLGIMSAIGYKVFKAENSYEYRQSQEEFEELQKALRETAQTMLSSADQVLALKESKPIGDLQGEEPNN